VLQLTASLSASAAAAQSIAEALFTNLAQIAQLSYTTLSLPSSAISTSDLSTLQSYYSQLYSRQGTIRYNISSVSDQLRTATTLPILLNQSSTQAVLAALSSTNASVFTAYAASLDLAFYIFAQNAKVRPFTNTMSSVHAKLLQLCKESSTATRLFATAWSAYSSSISTYTTIATSFASQTYTSADVRAYMATSAAVAAHTIEDNVLNNVVNANKDSLPPDMTTVPYAQFQVQQALWITLPAIILISAAAVFDAWYSHVFFALGHKWVPVNDPTAARSRLKFDSGRLWGNVRVIIPCCVVMCVCTVILASIVYAQGDISVSIESLRLSSTRDVLRSRRQMLSVNTELTATSFWWNRAVLSREPSDLDLAVAGVMQWSAYLRAVTSTWQGPTTTSVRGEFLNAVSTMEAVTRDVVLVCGFRIISLSYEYDQLSDITTFVDNQRPDVSTLIDCLGASAAAEFLESISTFEASVEKKLSSAVVSANLATVSEFTTRVANASCTAVDAYVANLTHYGRYFLGLSLADAYRLPPTALSSRLEGNVTALESAAQPYLNLYTPSNLEQSSTFAVFWVPVVLAWVAVPLVHLAYRRSADSVQSINYVS